MTLTLKSDGSPMIVSTPMGLITIRLESKEEVERRPMGQRRRKVHVTLPQGMRVDFSREKALNRSPFLKEENGRIMPKYNSLVPRIENGEWTGMEIPSDKPQPKRLTLV